MITRTLQANRRRSKPSSLIVALDIGTSSTRALLYDIRGEVLTNGELQIAYQQAVTADGGVSTNPDDLYRITLKALSGLLRSLDSATRDSIAGVGVSCFWHSLMGIDGKGNAITPLYSWADTRSSGDAADLAKTWDAAAYHKRTGAFIHSSYWPAKLTWLARTDSAAFTRVKQWISFAEFLFLNLFGDAKCSISMASGTGLFNQRADDWDEETLRRLPIERAHLPAIAAANYSPMLGIRAPRGLSALRDAPWFPAYGDGAASNVGAGGVDDSGIVVNVGTSGAIRILAKADIISVPSKLFTYRADRSRFVVGGAMSNGGNIYAWLHNVLKLNDDAVKRIADVRRKWPDGHGLTVLPLLAGERSPGWRPDAHGVVSGIHLSTTSDDIALAMLESVVYPFFEVWQELRAQFPNANMVTVSGGAFKHSTILAEIFADVFGCDVNVCSESEPSGRGAAILTAESLGLCAIARSHRPTLKKVRADSKRHEIYVSAMRRYHDLYLRTFTSPAEGTPPIPPRSSGTP